MITLDDEKENPKMSSEKTEELLARIAAVEAELKKHNPREEVLRSLFTEAHCISVDHGWWDVEGARGRFASDPDAQLAKLMLVVTEVAEAAEEIRNGSPLLYQADNGKPEGLLAELADVIIRIGDMVGALDAEESMAKAIVMKLEYNRTRPYRHGGKKA